MYSLGIASPAHELSPECWYAWGREPFHYGGFDYYGNTLLWTYQFPFAWWDFQNRRASRGLRINWFENSVTATHAHRAFCIDLTREFSGYSDDIWGITSCDGPRGYQTWGGPPRTGRLDGSVVPCAVAGSLMFTPDTCLPALHAIEKRFGSRIYQRYGFVDAFNPNTGWQADDVIGIDVGITLLSTENLRTGNIWKWFMANPEAPRAFALAGIQRALTPAAAVASEAWRPLDGALWTNRATTCFGCRHLNRSREELRWCREDAASVPLLHLLWAESLT
jgi:hypothetical protein